MRRPPPHSCPRIRDATSRCVSRSRHLPVPRSVYYAPLDRAGGGLQTRDVRVPGELRSVLCLLGALPGVARAQQPPSPWAFGPFHKPRAVNPVIAPDPSATFRSPTNDSLVRWEEHATFNPAAVVKDGTVYVLYRAEDASGDREIGHHTSRIGLAESTDGLRFTRRGAPVLYPDRDAEAPREWPGGVEDPRVVESDDGTYVLTYTQWNRRIPRLAVATSRDLLHWTKRSEEHTLSLHSALPLSWRRARTACASRAAVRRCYTRIGTRRPPASGRGASRIRGWSSPTTAPTSSRTRSGTAVFPASPSRRRAT